MSQLSSTERLVYKSAATAALGIITVLAVKGAIHNLQLGDKYDRLTDNYASPHFDEYMAKWKDADKMLAIEGYAALGASLITLAAAGLTYEEYRARRSQVHVAQSLTTSQSLVGGYYGTSAPKPTDIVLYPLHVPGTDQLLDPRHMPSQYLNPRIQSLEPIDPNPQG